MSDSEGRQELTGLARTVEALFAGVSGPLAAAQAVGEATDLAADEAMDLATDEAMDLAADEATDRGMPPPLPDTGDPSAVDPTVPSHEGAARGAVAEAAEPALPSGAGRMGDDAHPFEPTPLDSVVDAYLSGDRDRADEIERVAGEMLERREFDAIARSVARLAVAAGDAGDRDMLSLVTPLSTPAVLARLAKQMGRERDEERRRAYFRACRALGEPMALAIRDELAESTDRLARRIHCDALIEMGPPGRAVIEEMVMDENRFLVRNAVAILGDLGGERAVELVTSALANPDARVRREALRSLAKLGDEEVGPLVMGLLDDPDRDVRMAAATAAGELHVERALKRLVTMLDETKDPDETLPLIRALGQLGDPGAVASIEKHAVRTLFSRPRTDVRITAYRALSQIETPHARRLLNQAMDDRDPEVRAAVRDILHLR